jgi:hypothetical protein
LQDRLCKQRYEPISASLWGVLHFNDKALIGAPNNEVRVPRKTGLLAYLPAGPPESFNDSIF